MCVRLYAGVGFASQSGSTVNETASNSNSHLML